MLKVLRVSSYNPVSWQLSLVDSELDQILSGDSSIEGINHHNGSRKKDENANPLQKHQFLRKGGGMRGAALSKLLNHENNQNMNNKAQTARKELDEDFICGICQERMTEDEMEEDSLCYCKAQCGKSHQVLDF